MVKKIIGRRDGSEYETISKYNTFCSLCTRRIYKEEVCATWTGRQFFAHTDCSLVTDRITKIQFQREGRKKTFRKNKSTAKLGRGVSRASGKNWKDVSGSR